MAVGRVIDELGAGIFWDIENIIERMEFSHRKDDRFYFTLFSNIPNITKTDILEYFEYYILLLATGPFGDGRMEVDTNFIACSFSDLDKILVANTPTPTYISEYIGVIGDLFMAGYIDFGTLCDDKDHTKIDYPTNLSKYKNDKYEAWIYFRDNFFYKNRFDRGFDDDVLDENGCSLIISATSWDTPQYWSHYNIWTARTPKGDNYFNETLAPKFYKKYKDIEVEIDDDGNIIRWNKDLLKDKS